METERVISLIKNIAQQEGVSPRELLERVFPVVPPATSERKSAPNGDTPPLVIEPILAGRPLLPTLDQREATAYVALAIHNARPLLEKHCQCITGENDRQSRSAGLLAEALVIADVIVRRRVLAGMFDEPEGGKFELPLAGLAGLSRCDEGEALIWMSLALHEEGNIPDSPVPTTRAYVELMEARVIAEEVLHRQNIRTDRQLNGKGGSADNPTRKQTDSWGWNTLANLAA